MVNRLTSIHNYNDKSKITCLLNIFSLTLILVFFFFPFNKDGILGFFLKSIILLSLGTTLYLQVISSDELLNVNQLFSSETTINERNQFLFSSLFSVILLLFILFIVKQLFF